MNRHKGIWGRKALMNQGEKERFRISQRLKLYGTNLPYVDQALSFDGKDRDFPLSLMRQIQTNISQKYHMPTDRSAWRTKTGMKAWFCEYWVSIRDYVFQEISNIDLSQYVYENDKMKNMEPAKQLYDTHGTSLLPGLNDSDFAKCKINHIDSSPIGKSSTLSQPDTLYFLSIDYLLNEKKPMNSPLSA
mgnify:CR=1 FL=1